MDLRTVLSEVESWLPEDRLGLMERIWDGLLSEGYDLGLTDQQISELDRRLADEEAAPDDVVNWERVKADAFRRSGR